MSNEEIGVGETRDVISKWWQRFEAREWEETIALVDAGCEWVTPERTLQGAEQIEGLVRAYAEAFPDLRHEFGSFIESGDRAATENVLMGTHLGVLRTPAGDVPPTGKAIRFEFSDFITVRDGRITSMRSYYDSLALPTQLGLLSTGASSSGGNA